VWKKALPMFDRAYWSDYWVPEDLSNGCIASMMYHNLHICQLEILTILFERDFFRAYQERFELYAKLLLNRLRAAVAISKKRVS
jgi:hypothetical protein